MHQSLLNADPALARRFIRLERLQRKGRAEGRLIDFIRQFWDILEPSREFVDGWHIQAICDHLEAVSRGEIIRLLINVPPGSSKSLSTEVFWPAWEWGPANMPAMRYVSASYSDALTIRDNLRFRRLVESERYRDLWGDRFKPSRDQWGKEKLQNDKTGWKIATSVQGLGTGERGDRFIIDDPHNVTKAESEAVRESTIKWFLETVPTRMNDPERSAIVVIMQRVHEADVAGVAIAREMGYEHLCLPMRYDPARHCVTSISFEDPRGVDPVSKLPWHPDDCQGALLDEIRFPEHVVKALERDLGPYAAAAQLQQEPSPRGGGILKREWWKTYPDDIQGAEPEAFDKNGKPVRPLEYPVSDLIVASLDTAYTEKQENDWNALTIWSVWRDASRMPRVLLIEAWREHLPMRGLVDKVIDTCRRRTVDHLLIEAKANGISVAQEISRLCMGYEWMVHPINPKGDKVGRAHAVVPLFAGGIIYRPKRPWSEMVVDECSVFPKGKHDDLVDSTTQALLYLRRIGVALLTEESQADQMAALQYESALEPLYDV